MSTNHTYRFSYTAPVIRILQAIQNALRILPDDSADAKTYAITGVNIGDSTFTIAGKYVNLFNPNYKFTVDGSTGNDQGFKVSDSVYGKDANTTTVTVTGTIPDATVDGNILAVPLVFGHVVITPTPMPPSTYPAVYIFADPVANTDGEAVMQINVQIADQLGNPTDAYLALLELVHQVQDYLSAKAVRGEFVSGMYLSNFIETGFGVDIDPPAQVGAEGPPPIQWMNITTSYDLIEEQN